MNDRSSGKVRYAVNSDAVRARCRKLCARKNKLVRKAYRRLRRVLNWGVPAAGEVWEPYRVGADEWESQYRSGHWGYMGQLHELARYSVIVGYLQYLKYGGSILDVGCGEGILQARLCPHAYSRYVGIDVSREAIDQASCKADHKTSFVCADVESYIPAELFDAIVFNEILYYLDAPLEVLKRYESYLEEDGIFVISMFVSKKTALCWTKLETAYRFVDETKSTHKGSGRSWICKVGTVSGMSGESTGQSAGWVAGRKGP